MPKAISVITINYNNLKGLMRTFDSVNSQTAREQIEFIVVDGNSTDGGKEFLEENKSKIDILFSEKDNGLYDAMNKGIKAATGNYLWFVNSGDAIYRNDIAQSLISILSGKMDVVFGDTMFIDDAGKEIGLISSLKPQKLPKKLNPFSFRYGMNICHQSFIVKRELCPYYNLDYKQAADIDWILKILKRKPTNLNSNLVISAFETGGSSTQNENRAWKERFSVLTNYYGLIPNLFAHIWIIFRRLLFNLGLWKLVK